MRKINIIWIFVSYFWFSEGCSSYDSHLRNALDIAGSNREEMVNVLKHFSQDSLKLEASEFLIKNMPGHYSYTGKYLDDYEEKLKDIKSISPFMRKVLLSLIYDNPQTVKHLVKREDIQTLTADFLIKHIEDRFYLWETCPWLKCLNFEEFCEYVLPYRIAHERLSDRVDSTYVGYEENRAITTIYDDINCSVGGVSSLYFPKTFYYETLLPAPFNQVFKTECRDLCLLKMFYYRAAGGPSAIDFVPAWGNSNGYHYWAAVIDPVCKNILDQGIFYRKIPKVYRYVYSREEKLQDTNYIPKLFVEPFLRDVTSLYINTTHMQMKLPDSLKILKYVYLSVFNKREWVPVAFSSICRGQACFKNMGYDIVYLPVYYDSKVMKNLFYPFILRRSGDCKSLVPDKRNLQTLCLKRKYHYNHLAQGGRSMLGTTFECSNDSTFDYAEIFYKVTTNTHMSRQRITCPGEKYKYWRIRPYASCGLAELNLIDTSGRVVNDSLFIIRSYENTSVLFDGNPLTFIQSNGCLDIIFDHPIQLQAVECLPLNDGNGICPDNEYELCYFDKNGWQTFEHQKADSDSLVFKKVPSGALYWLKNLTTGKQERIFTSEKGKIKFW